MKKIGRVDEKVYRKKVYEVRKDGEVVYEGITDDVIKYLGTTHGTFNTTLWRAKKKNRKIIKYKGFILQHTQNCLGDRVYAVVSRQDGKEIFRGARRKIAAEYKYKMETLKNYTSNNKPILIRRKKYDLVPTGEYDIIWKRV